jgi:hypothetical protein
MRFAIKALFILAWYTALRQGFGAKSAQALSFLRLDGNKWKCYTQKNMDTTQYFPKKQREK